MKKQLLLPTALVVSTVIAIGCNQPTRSGTFPRAPTCVPDAGYVLRMCRLPDGSDCYRYSLDLPDGGLEYPVACGTDGGTCVTVTGANGTEYFTECRLDNTCSEYATEIRYPDGAVESRVFC